MKIEIIPAIDIIGGECVRLVQGDYLRKTSYFKDPLEVAKRYEGIGARRLHVVDLDGAKASRPVNLDVMRRIAGATSLDVQWGGGVKSAEALDEVFAAGAARAICGSIAITSPKSFEEWLKQFGPDRMILGADVKDGKIAINGWEESSDEGVSGLISRFLSFGLERVICTDISKDGMLQGPSFALYEALYREFPALDITASGGIRDVDDIKRLDGMGCRSVVVGKALYEGKITLEEIEKLF